MTHSTPISDNSESSASREQQPTQSPVIETEAEIPASVPVPSVQRFGKNNSN